MAKVKTEKKSNVVSLFNHRSLETVLVNTAEPRRLYSQSNALVNAIYDLSLYESRLIMLAISKVNPLAHKSDQQLTVMITASEWAQYFNVPMKKTYGQMIEAKDSIMQNPLKVSAVDGQGRTHYLDMQWLDSAYYVEGQGRVEVTFGRRIQPHLINLADSGYTSAVLNFAGRLGDSRSIKLYGLLYQFINTGFRIEAIENARALLNCPELMNTGDFMRYVVNKTLKEISELTDISATVEQVKKGRVITHLKFYIRRKEQLSLNFETIAEV